MKRRDLLKLGGMALAQAGAARFPLLAQTTMPMHPAALADGKADYTLRIAPVMVELDRSHIISTIGYNGTAPGPVLRMREGKPVTVDVIKGMSLEWPRIEAQPEDRLIGLAEQCREALERLVVRQIRHRDHARRLGRPRQVEADLRLAESALP